MRTTTLSVDVSNNRPARNRRNKRPSVLGQFTDELQSRFNNDIQRLGLCLKAVSAHLGRDSKGKPNVSLNTLKSFRTSVYVNAPRVKLLRAIVACSFVSDETRTVARMILARKTGEYGVEFLAGVPGERHVV